ncbi:hypothetical protein Tco_1355836 [Tanacetum coccineum]
MLQFESGSYRSYLEHTTLYEALEASMDRENREEFIEEMTKSCKRCRDDQDPPPPPPKDSDRKLTIKNTRSQKLTSKICIRMIFEDLYLLHLQGKLNYLSGADKVYLFNAFNLWIRNIVIRRRVKDLQLGIKSYQTKLNLTQPSWDASYFQFKEDYTIVHKPRAVIYKDRNNQKKMIRETEVHKFSDGTLTRILKKLYHMVKDFRLFKYNSGMEFLGMCI